MPTIARRAPDFWYLRMLEMPLKPQRIESIVKNATGRKRNPRRLKHANTTDPTAAEETDEYDRTFIVFCNAGCVVSE